MRQRNADIPGVGRAQHGQRLLRADMAGGGKEQVVKVPRRHQLVIGAALDGDDVVDRAHGPDRARGSRFAFHQCTAAYMIVSSSALWPSNSSTTLPCRQTRMRSESWRISGR